MATIKLTCCTADGRATEIEVSPGTTFEDLKSILAVEFQAQPEWIKLSFRGDTSIPDHETIGNQGIQNNDMLLVIIQRTYGDNFGTAQQPGQQQQMQQDVIPPFLRGLLQQFGVPQNNNNGGNNGMNQGSNTRNNANRAQMIDENFQMAMNESPESFASVYMLYIDVYINDVLVKAFVDSGAQTTVMSRACAERTGVIGLVDPRFAGVAVGVGHARIIGRVHLAPVKITGERNAVHFYNCSFAVLDSGSAGNMDLLIGLDMLKKYQCNIDLKNDRLVFGTTNQTVKFLPENQLPDHARLHFVAVKDNQAKTFEQMSKMNKHL